MQLPGTYRVTTVDTTQRVPYSSTRGGLTLRVADTLERYYERRLRGLVRTGNRPVVGQWEWRGSDGILKTDPVAIQQNPGGTVLISGFCTLCLDAAWIYYGIREVRADGFSGWWNNPQTGIGKIVDEHGGFAPDPGGYFCAFRTP